MHAVRRGGIASAASGEKAASSESLKLWYQQAASTWTEALPLGNGRLGARVFGAPAKERFQFNESSLWLDFGKLDAVSDYHREIRELKPNTFKDVCRGW